MLMADVKLAKDAVHRACHNHFHVRLKRGIYDLLKLRPGRFACGCSHALCFLCVLHGPLTTNAVTE